MRAALQLGRVLPCLLLVALHPRRTYGRFERGRPIGPYLLRLSGSGERGLRVAREKPRPGQRVVPDEVLRVEAIQLQPMRQRQGSAARVASMELRHPEHEVPERKARRQFDRLHMTPELDVNVP